MPLKISSDGKVEVKEIGIVSVQERKTKQRRTKANKKKNNEVSRGPKNCPYATLLEKDRGLYECNMWLYHSDSDVLEEWEPVRLMEGAGLCVDCDRRPHIIEEDGGKKKNE